MEYEFYHHGILGQKWGVRHYQNEDGTLTPAGRDRYGLPDKKEKTNKKSNVIYDGDDLGGLYEILGSKQSEWNNYCESLVKKYNNKK